MVFTLDGATLGRCPIDSAAVAPGGHTLCGWPVEGRKFSAGPITRKVFVRPGAELVIDLSGVRWVRVETEPFGAAVTRGGIPLGETPLVIAVSPGDPPIIVEKEGYLVAAMTAGSLLSGVSPIRLELEPDRTKSVKAAASAFAPPAQPRLNSTTALLGIAVVASATAAVVLNAKSDDVFEEYRTTGDLRRMDELFRKAERLDSWAVASWAASEAALGVLLYRLLREPKPEPEPADERPMEGLP